MSGMPIPHKYSVGDEKELVLSGRVINLGIGGYGTACRRGDVHARHAAGVRRREAACNLRASRVKLEAVKSWNFKRLRRFCRCGFIRTRFFVFLHSADNTCGSSALRGGESVSNFGNYSGVAVFSFPLA